jgi:hypothetical protein
MNVFGLMFIHSVPLTAGTHVCYMMSTKEVGRITAEQISLSSHSSISQDR